MKVAMTDLPKFHTCRKCGTKKRASHPDGTPAVENWYITRDKTQLLLDVCVPCRRATGQAYRDAKALKAKAAETAVVTEAEAVIADAPAEPVADAPVDDAPAAPKAKRAPRKAKVAVDA